MTVPPQPPYPPYPPPQPSYPAPQPQPMPGRPHRSYTRLIVIVSVVVLVGGLAVAGGGALTWRYFNNLAKPKTLPSAVSNGPIYRKLPSARSLPAAEVRRLVPGAEETNCFDNKPDPDRGDGPRAYCQWDMSVAEGKRRNQTRTLEVDVTAYPDGAEPAAKVAKEFFDQLLEAPKKNATDTSDSSYGYGAVTPVDGLGQEAYAQDSVTRTSRTYGGTSIWATVDNLVIVVRYSGSEDANGKEKPMSARQAHDDAEAAARKVLNTLTSCADCRT